MRFTEQIQIRQVEKGIKKGMTKAMFCQVTSNHRDFVWNGNGGLLVFGSTSLVDYENISFDNASYPTLKEKEQIKTSSSNKCQTGMGNC